VPFFPERSPCLTFGSSKAWTEVWPFDAIGSGGAVCPTLPQSRSHFLTSDLHVFSRLRLQHTSQPAAFSTTASLFSNTGSKAPFVLSPLTTRVRHSRQFRKHGALQINAYHDPAGNRYSLLLLGVDRRLCGPFTGSGCRLLPHGTLTPIQISNYVP
jgi:hypothetical protein